tara:strand:+ start:57 stop:1964 length:1908 start_codon:yes stop_codon:yes gene_type:complete
MAYYDKYLNSYDQTIADIEARSDRNVGSDYNPIQPVEAGYRDNVEQGIATVLGLFGGTERSNLKQAKKLTGVGDLLPFTGTGLAVADFEDARQNKDGTGMLLAGVGGLPFVGPAARALANSAGNLVNQVAKNMPTRIEGFYSGNPIGSFVRDASYEVKGAIGDRMSAASRAYEDVWGVTRTKMDDFFNKGGPAQRLREKGKPDEAVGYGDDAEKTALAIEAQQGDAIIPLAERGALANGVYGLSYYDVGIPADDLGRLGSGIGNAHRATPDVPDNIVDKAVNHLVNGPHVKSGSGELYEYQIKTLESSKQAGVREGAGTGVGSPLVRAFNARNPDGKAVSPFLAYGNFLSKTINKSKELSPPSPKDTVEFTQLATMIDKDATRVLNDLLPRKRKKGKQNVDTRTLLERISKARAKKRAGITLSAEQRDALNAFEEGIRIGNIKPRAIKDESGEVVSSLNYDDIKEPKGYITAQQSYASTQKELGGVNQLLIVDPYNQVTYSMVSDGHDIFGMAPVGGHHLITAQPIVKQNWTDRGYNPKEHNTMYTPENVSRAVQDTEKRTGVPATKGTRNATNSDYLTAARVYTKNAMKQPVTPTGRNRTAANLSTAKVVGAGGAGIVAGGVPTYNMLTGDNEE